MTRARTAASDRPPSTRHRLLGGALFRYIRLIARTGQLITSPPDAIDAMERDGPVIIAFWHGQFALLPLARPPGPVDAMVARHGDAELIGELLRRFDMTLIRGAGASGRRKDRGGAGALRAALTSLEQGRHVAMTADVPPNQVRQVGDGILTLARLSGAPIYPCAIATSRFHTMNTASRFTLNFPFSQISAAGGPPISVPPDADAEHIEAKRDEVALALHAVTKQAYAGVGRTPEIEPDRDVEKRKRPFTIKTYQALTRHLVHLNADRIIGRRAARGKEDLSRRNERLGKPERARPDTPVIWVHAASVGEFLAVLPVLEAINQKIDPASFTVLMTTGTKTSADLASRRLPANALHQYVPLDTPQAIDGFLEHWQPELTLLVESELWPNTLLGCGTREIPIMLVNARMSKRSFRRWKKLPSLSRPLLANVESVLAQSPRMARRFRILGARDAVNVGNLKVDIQPQIPPKKDVEAFSKSLGTDDVFVAASTHSGEDATILDAHLRLRDDWPTLKTIIAPRHPERADEIAALTSERGLSTAKRSNNDDPRAAAVYIADTIGELPLFYSVASAAFIGGTLIEHGGQNPVEAVRCGAVILAGPDRTNFEDIFATLSDANSVTTVNDADDCARAVAHFLAAPQAANEDNTRARHALDAISGAMQKTVDHLVRTINRELSDT